MANDGTSCWLFANRGNFQFDEIGEAAGVARDAHGTALAGMGVAVGDSNRDGLCDLVVTNFLGRSTVAFEAQPDRPGTYRDSSSRLGLASLTRHVLGFGVALADFDGDGRLDLVQSNGHVLDRARLGTPATMKPTLLRGTGEKFEDGSRSAGAWFDRPNLGRGLAVGDLDGDGRPDLVATCLDAPAALLFNTSVPGQFLALDIIDHSGRPAVGARVRVMFGGQSQVGVVGSGGSYLSASPATLFFGMSRAHGPELVEVDWPWGQRELWTNPMRPGQVRVRIESGTGRIAP